MTQEQKMKDFVDKWVGKHGFAGIFHNYRKDCIQDLTNLLDNWISVEDELPKHIKDDKEYLVQFIDKSKDNLKWLEVSKLKNGKWLSCYENENKKVINILEIQPLKDNYESENSSRKL